MWRFSYMVRVWQCREDLKSISDARSGSLTVRSHAIVTQQLCSSPICQADAVWLPDESACSAVATHNNIFLSGIIITDAFLLLSMLIGLLRLRNILSQSTLWRLLWNQGGHICLVYQLDAEREACLSPNRASSGCFWPPSPRYLPQRFFG